MILILYRCYRRFMRSNVCQRKATQQTKKTIHSIDDLTKGLSQKKQSETVDLALRGLAKAIDEIEETRIKAVLVANNL